MTWKTQIPDQMEGMDQRHLYIYRYDNSGKMTAGYYAAENSVLLDYFDVNPAKFDERVTYDLNGNILQLLRYSDAGDVDALNYTYLQNSNRLHSISDQPHSLAYQPQWDYHDINTSGADFEYDANGNIITDNDKGTTTTYNFLNLPETITKNGTTITYVYDASGKKVAKKNSQSNDINYYSDGIEYLNTDLQLILHSEGRIRPIDISTLDFAYDYFIKDHLGSVRAVVTSESSRSSYMATMEMQNDPEEQDLFEYISETRADKPGNAPADMTYFPDQKVSLLNAALGQTTGHAKFLKLMKGEKVDIDVKYFFDDIPFTSSPSINLNSILNNFAQIALLNPGINSGFSLEQAVDWTNQNVINNLALQNFINTSLTDLSNTNVDKPKAYLVHLFFNEKFNLITDASGIYQATNPDQLGELITMNNQAPSSGYMYIYVTNESEKDVSFDNLRIQHNGSPVLEINHYYPYGQLIEDLYQRSTLVMANQKKYCSKEIENELDLNMYDHGARMYDPLTARWVVQDPASQFHNPYFAMGGNPVAIVDPDGKWAGWAWVITTIVASYLGGAVANDDFNPGNWNWKSPDTWIGIGTGAALGGLAGLAVNSSIKGKMGTSVGLQNGNSIAGFEYNNGWYLNWVSPAGGSGSLPLSASTGDGPYISMPQITPEMTTYHFFSNEAKAYQYMWDKSIQYNREYSAYLLENGVLVNPSYRNDDGRADNNYLQTKTDERNYYVFYNADWRIVLGNIHTHLPTDNSLLAGQDGGFSDADYRYNKGLKGGVSYIMAWDATVDAIAHNIAGTEYERDWFHNYYKNYTIRDLFSGKLKLIPFLKNDYKKW